MPERSNDASRVRCLVRGHISHRSCNLISPKAQRMPWNLMKSPGSLYEEYSGMSDRDVNAARLKMPVPSRE